MGDEQYIEFPEGYLHGNVINDGMPGIFEFFKANTLGLGLISR